ncbi:hypothetical protein BT63DRAFT_177146 [Microthyrium microscopicum]|uniref:Protein BCP1 n=1 Tax=Microthyrium microscopicum TaxID=703497 RepID=A0A6A6UJN4_9PEZI|nr:hypothetical protein BT63DRAFT_177146 [Microthyrium microscopicum]
MVKRKPEELGEVATSKGRGEEDESSDDDMDMLDVDFEFFDPQPDVDFHGLKSLCRQLFDLDAQLFDLSALVDLILSQPTLGSTVKCDGNESDPFAFLTVLNLHQHRDKPIIQTIIKYLSSKASKVPNMSGLLDSTGSSSRHEVGLILTERLINMPAEIVPPMYNMLMEEVEWANQDNEPYTFSHYLILSKTYKEVESKLDAEETRSSKKMKKSKAVGDNTFYFHPEDETLHKYAMAYGNFDYTSVPDEGRPDSKRTFNDLGIVPQGHLILIERSKFEEAVKAVSQYLQPQA